MGNNQPVQGKKCSIKIYLKLTLMKSKLGEKTSTSTSMLNAETGNLGSIHFIFAICKSIITHWLSVVQSGDKSLINVVYHQLEQHNKTWVSKEKSLLYNAGFGDVWEITMWTMKRYF